MKGAEKALRNGPRDEPGPGDDIPCRKCAAALDTGLECTECGFDMAPEIYAAPQALPAAAAGSQAQPNRQEALAQTIAQQNGKGTA